MESCNSDHIFNCFERIKLLEDRLIEIQFNVRACGIQDGEKLLLYLQKCCIQSLFAVLTDLVVLKSFFKG